MIGDCEICGTFFATPAQLMGEYNVVICFPCRNEWHKHIRNLPEREAFITAIWEVKNQEIQRSQVGRDLLFNLEAGKEKMFLIAEGWAKAKGEALKAKAVQGPEEKGNE